VSRPTTAAKSESDQDDRKESPGWEKSQQENPQKATPFESNSIMQMLTDKRYPTWGVSRLRGRVVTNQQLLEAVSYELTGSLEETERYRCSVEQCAKYLNEEEGIA